MTIKKLSRSTTNLLIIIALAVCSIALFVYWYQTSYLNANRVFWGTINNNLKTSSVTRTNVQNLDNNQKLTQVTQVQYAPNLVAKSTVTVEGENNQKVVTETIGTATADFLRYTTLNIADQSKDNSKTLGKWAKAPASEQQKPQILADALLGSVLFFGNLSKSQRSELVNELESTKAFEKIELASRENKDGRKVYTYNVTISLQPYSQVYKKYLEMIGQKEIAAQIGQQQSGSTYKALLAINATSRQPISISSPGSEQPELYSNFGQYKPLEVPQTDLSISELQSQLRQ